MGVERVIYDATTGETDYIKHWTFSKSGPWMEFAEKLSCAFNIAG